MRNKAINVLRNIAYDKTKSSVCVGLKADTLAYYIDDGFGVQSHTVCYATDSTKNVTIRQLQQFCELFKARLVFM